MAAEQQQPPAKLRAGSGSRFAVTCGLLRQYMKEQGGNGGRLLAPPVAAMGLMPGAAGATTEPAAVGEPEETTTTVLELFPQQAGTLKDAQERKEPGRAPLTIFYGGRMLVFDDFPAEKAEEIMQLAGSSCNVDPAAAAAAAAAVSQNALGQPPSLPDMPIARKASLQRFLEKRKSRLTAGDPYPAPSPSVVSESTKPVKKEEDAPWLGVNSMLSLRP